MVSFQGTLHYIREETDQRKTIYKRIDQLKEQVMGYKRFLTIKVAGSSADLIMSGLPILLADDHPSSPGNVY